MLETKYRALVLHDTYITTTGTAYSLQLTGVQHEHVVTGRCDFGLLFGPSVIIVDLFFISSA